MTKRQLRVYRIAAMGVFTALSIVLVYFIHLPIFPAVPFLEYDPADIPIIICAYLYGPQHGLILTVIVSVVQGLTVSAQSGWIGILMHILSTGALVIANSGLRVLLLKRKEKAGVLSRAGLVNVVSLVAGVVAMTATMGLCNLLFTPMFMGVTLDVVLTHMPFIIAFNVIKAAINSVIVLAVYKLMPQKLIERLS